MRLVRDLPTVYLHRDVVDFRKSIDGLAAIVEQLMDLDPFADALYVFCNRHRDRHKVPYWDQTGFCHWYKRLEKSKPVIDKLQAWLTKTLPHVAPKTKLGEALHYLHKQCPSRGFFPTNNACPRIS